MRLGVPRIARHGARGGALRVVVALVMACGLGCGLWLGGFYWRDFWGWGVKARIPAPTFRPRITPGEAERLFRSLELSNEYPEAAQAAKKLTRTKGGEQWVVLWLLDDTSRTKQPTGEKQEDRKRFTVGDPAITAVLLRSIPPGADRSVLWAVTDRLSDGQQGSYAVEGKNGAYGIGNTRPMLIIARETLKRCLGVDHLYDKLAWRAEIMKPRR